MDVKCPVHGGLRTRGRVFQGYVTRKHKTRLAIEFDRVVKVRKYDRYAKSKTRIHAHIPACLREQVKIGDYITVQECRPLSKIIHHVVTDVLNAGHVQEELKQ